MGPNLLAPGNTFGASIGLPKYVGPFVFSMVTFAAPALVTAPSDLPTPSTELEPDANQTGADAAVSATRPLGSLAALRWAARQPIARFAVALVAAAHAVMVMVMVMTPVHMEGSGDSLELVGFTISLHIVGMYGLSPVFGWAIDRFGAGAVALTGIGIEVAALITGFIAAGGDTPLVSVALLLLGLGRSGALLLGASLLATITPPHIRVPLQGASDALLNYAGEIGRASCR